LERSRLDGQGARLARAIAQAVDDAKPSAERSQLRRKGQSRGSGAHDEHVEVGGGHSHGRTLAYRARARAIVATAAARSGAAAVRRPAYAAAGGPHHLLSASARPTSWRSPAQAT